MATYPVLVSTLRASLIFAIAGAALHCGGSAFTVADGDGSTGEGDSDLGSDASDEGSFVPPADATEDRTASDARADATRSPDAPADAPSDRNVPDGPVVRDAAVDISSCSAICAGCCDATGHCQAGNTAAVCGAAGALCEDCSTMSCPIVTDFGCCKTGGGCGCGIGGIVGCS